MSHITRKLVFVVCDQVRLKPACWCTEASQSLGSFDIKSIDTLPKQWTTKTLIRLRIRAGWFASLLFAYVVKQVFSWCGSYTFPCQNMSPDMTKPTTECAPSDDSDQPGHPPSLISVFAVRMKKAWVVSYPLSAHQRLWSDWADAQADLSLSWTHSHFVGFVTRRLIFFWGSCLQQKGAHYGHYRPLHWERKSVKKSMVGREPGHTVVWHVWKFPSL